MIYVAGMTVVSIWLTWMTIKFQAPQAVAYVTLILTIFVAACELFIPKHKRGVRK